MNEAKWEAFAVGFAAGEHEPANGREEWTRIAKGEAALIRSLLPRPVKSILEVGCGIGRLTPHLARLFGTVHATDTSNAMLELTAAACADQTNVTYHLVTDAAPAPQRADAAVIWGNLYDEDWTVDAATNHIFDLACHYSYVLVQTRRQPIRDLWRHTSARADWFLIGKETA